MLQHDSKLIKTIDNLNRTALHYAYGTKNQEIIDILLSYKINKFVKFFIFKIKITDLIYNF